jgi:hypothetical protein
MVAHSSARSFKSIEQLMDIYQLRFEANGWLIGCQNNGIWSVANEWARRSTLVMKAVAVSLRVSVDFPARICWFQPAFTNDVVARDRSSCCAPVAGVYQTSSGSICFRESPTAVYSRASLQIRRRKIEPLIWREGRL